MYVYMCVCLLTVCGGQWLTSGIFLCHSLSCFSRQDLTEPLAQSLAFTSPQCVIQKMLVHVVMSKVKFINITIDI